MGPILTLALLLAVAVFLARRGARRRAGVPTLSGPGSSPQNPRSARSFADLDEALSHLRCPCGGNTTPLGEGTQLHGGRELRVLRARCTHCEAQHSLYFQLLH